MRILHTSDWHLGASLYGYKRYEESSLFLNWLTETIESEKIDLLLISGDIFDNSTPSNRAQEQYYRFLCRISGSCCKNIIITGGNHDSPSFLNAPKELLRALNVHVIGSAPENINDEVIVVKSDKGSAIVCAVPYLRDRDIRTVETGESAEDKNKKLLEGIKKHYEDVVKSAECRRTEMTPNAQNSEVPIIVMGHFFTSGGKTIKDDGVRELYVGNLTHVDKSNLPGSVDYFALGHLHIPQKVGGSEHIRYSGSPLPMGFGEAYQTKSVVIADFNEPSTDISLKEIPCFQPLERITGTLEEILSKIEDLKNKKSNAWLEIEYTAEYTASNLKQTLEDSVADSELEIRRIKNKNIMDKVLEKINTDETLDELSVYDVFERCMEVNNVPPEEKAKLNLLYNEIVQSIHENDVNAE